MSRSFTLLETVVATALLAMLAASALSALQSISRAADRAAGLIDIGAFSRIVDDLLADPGAHGLPELADGAAWHNRRAQHPEHGADILIRRTAPESLPVMTAASGTRRHAWLIFETEGAAVARWLPLPAPKEPAP